MVVVVLIMGEVKAVIQSRANAAALSAQAAAAAQRHQSHEARFAAAIAAAPICRRHSVFQIQKEKKGTAEGVFLSFFKKKKRNRNKIYKKKK